MDFLTNTENIRNICILAHVDHGKTTIADSLIASNGIISHKMAGKMRYLDNRQEEQERGITMKSSSIALKYQNDAGEKFLINLVDTPGHVDFCGEVSAAVRLCDGALIVVDVVEGVCSQTKAALEQAWNEGIEPILVLNKIDRLVVERQLDETAAYLRLSCLLEQVNAIVATLLNTELLEDESKLHSSRQDTKESSTLSNNSNSVAGASQVYDWTSGIEDVDDDKYYFMPEKNNVIFASSIDDWGFTIGVFAEIISKKHKISLDALRKTLWGDYYIDTKNKRILRHAQAKAKKNLFTSMVLESIWKIYDTVVIRRDKDKMKKLCEALGIELSQRDIDHSDSRYQIKLIMSRWLKLSKHALDCVSKVVPSPRDLCEKRIERLLSSSLKKFHQLPDETRKLKETFLQCSHSADAVKVACVSKMIPLEEKRSNQTVSEANVSNTVFLGFARVFSGRLSIGDKLFVLGPRHDPSQISQQYMDSIDEEKSLEDLKIDEHVTVARIEKLFLLMGRDVEPIDYAPAGNIVGIQGLERHLLRTATLSDNIYCPPFNDLHVSASPILRVAIEPKNPNDTQVLMKGLKLLNQADPCVEIKFQRTGEHVIVATGEVHLQHCIKDLTERYTDGLELNVSPPIVPFRETIVLPPKTDMVNETIVDKGVTSTSKKQDERQSHVELMTPNRRCKIRLEAVPLPEEVIDFLSKSHEELKLIAKLITAQHKSSPTSIEELSECIQKKVGVFKDQFKAKISEVRKSKADWRNLYSEDFVDRIWSFGPRYSGSNLLVSYNEVDLNYSLWKRISQDTRAKSVDAQDSLENYIDSFVSGFQLATQSGPLCAEPMSGVCFKILDWKYIDEGLNQVALESTANHVENNLDHEEDVESIASSGLCAHKDGYGPMSGQIISTVKECCRKAFQIKPQRLMSPMFSCNIQVTTDVLGKVYALIGKRNGRVKHGDMREGSQTFEIEAFIPVIESLDFVSEIRKQTSGLANPQLIFSHYEIIDVDPFWTPRTEEEYTLYGEKADTENRALRYMNLVRRRKGLAVQEKIVEHGEKQRTIKKNK